MTVPTTISRNDYIGNGAVSSYPFTFRIFDAGDLLVVERDNAGDETVLALGTDYAVTGVGSQAGGAVVLSAGNLEAGHRLAIRRVLDPVQETELRNQGSFFAETHEAVFDRLTMLLQQQQDELNRALKLGETDAGSAPVTLPAPDANKVLRWDSDGNLINADHGSTALAVPADGSVTQAKTSGLSNWTIVAGGGNTPRSLATRFGQLVYVQDFGAVGDGTADDAAAIQAAINHAATIARLVYVPAGTYQISAAIELKGVCLRGAGMGRTILRAGATGENATAQMIRAVGESADGSAIEHMTIDLDGPARFASGEMTGGVSTIWLEDVQDCRIEACRLIGMGRGAGDAGVGNRGNGIFLFRPKLATRDTARNTVRRVIFDDPDGDVSFGIRVYSSFTDDEQHDEPSPTDGLPHYNRDNVVEQCIFIGISKNSVEVVGPDAIANIVRDCTAIDHAGFGAFEVDFGGRWNTIERCVCDGLKMHPDILDSKDAAFFLIGGVYAGINSARPRGNRVIDCVIRNVRTAHTGILRGVSTRSADDTVVRNVVMEDCQRMAGSTPEDFSVTSTAIILSDTGAADVSGCVVRQSAAGKGWQFGVLIRNAGLPGVIRIRDCDITVSGRGIREDQTTAGGDRIEIHHCRLRVGNEGIRLEGDIPAFDIRGCDIAFLSGATSQAIRLDKANQGVVSDCRIDYTNTTSTLPINVTGSAQALVNNFILGPNASASNVIAVEFQNTRTSVVGNRFTAVSGVHGGMVKYRNAAPGTGAYEQGDLVWNTAPSSGGPSGWICVTAGSPGTWRSFGRLGNQQAAIADATEDLSDVTTKLNAALAALRHWGHIAT